MGAIKTGWDFFQDQILGMHWLKDLIGNLLVKAGMGESRFPGEFLYFFIYDVIKIFVLLAVLIFLISYIQSYFPPERSKKIMGRFHGIWANMIGALLGTVTPFCSCSSIPIFMGFTSAGLPLGVTFSFLISSPMVDLGSLVLLMSVFGGKIAFAYVIVGLIVAVAGGTLIEKLHMEDQVEEFIRQAQNVDIESPKLTVGDRMNYAKNQVISTVKKVAPYIFIGVAIGAAIHNLIPEHMVRSILGEQKWYAVPLATVVAASEPKLLSFEAIGLMSDCIRPVCCRMPTYAMTKITIEMVGSISSMPPVENSVSSTSKPVLLTTPVFAAATAVPRSAPCRNTASTIASSTPSRNDGIAGTCITMQITITTRGISVTGPMA